VLNNSRTDRMFH